MQPQLLTWPEDEAYLETRQGIIADRFDRAARPDRTDRYPARPKRGSPALMRGCGSGYRKLGKQSLAFSLRAEQQRDHDTDRGGDGSDQHRNGIAKVEVDREEGQHRRH